MNGSAIGRPSHLTDEKKIASILKWIRAGVHGETAARAEGVSKPTFYRWLQDAGHADLKLEEGLGISEYEVRVRDFRDRHDQAEAYSEGRMVAEARAQARRQASAQGTVSILERRFPERWRFRQTNEITGPEGGPLQYTDLTDEEIETKLRRLADIAQEVTR